MWLPGQSRNTPTLTRATDNSYKQLKKGFAATSPYVIAPTT